MGYNEFVRINRDARLVSAAQQEFAQNRGYASPAGIPENQRPVFNRRWLVSNEKAKLDIALARNHDLPLAEAGLTSYRYKGPYGYIMIGAIHHDDALKEASRSLFEDDTDISLLEVWSKTDEAYKQVESYTHF